MARARGAREGFALAFESVYGTSPGANFLTMPFITNGLSSDRPLLEDDILGTRDPGDHALDVSTVDGDLSVPLDCEAMGGWLKATFGAPTTTENTGVYTHVFQSNAWALPSFTAERMFPDVASYHLFTGCMVDRLQVALQRGGLASATVGVIGQAVAKSGSSSAGTPSAFTMKRFTHGHGQISIDGSPVGNVVRAGFDYRNNLDRVDTITGDANIAGLDPLRTSLAMDLVIRFDSETLFSKAVSGTPVALSYALTRSADEKLTLAAARVFLPEPRVVTDGPGGLQATFSAMASRESDGDPMLTATLINGVSAY